jgi:predicted SAM-dependent methyltransferase
MPKQVKLHLGSGKRYLAGYHHRDITHYSHTDSIGSIGDLSIFGNEQVDEIYCSHALEYLNRSESLAALKEWYRVLKPGGNVKIAVPDFQALLRIYSLTGRLSAVLGPLFGQMDSDQGSIYHRTTYDLADLTKVLESAGFSEVTTYNPVAFLFAIDPDYDDHSLAFFPHLDRSGIQVSLCLEASKER